MVANSTYVPSLAYGAACRTEQQMSRHTWTLANLATINAFTVTAIDATYNPDEGPPHASQVITPDSLIIWRPSGDGAANLHVISSKPGLPDPHVLNNSTTIADYASRNLNTSESNSALDPNVRSVYEDMCVRDLDAKCVISINMGGGYATLRAKPLLHAHFGKNIDQLLSELKTDIHDTKSYRIGYDNKKGARIVFHPWLQSKKALGEWTSELSAPRPLDDGTTTLQNNPTFGYSDSFPFGGWMMCFSELAPMLNLGATPTMTIVSRLDVQVQLDSTVNHLRIRQHNLTAKQLHDHHEKDKQPNVHASQGDAMAHAFESAIQKTKQKPPGGGKGFLAKGKKSKPQPAAPAPRRDLRPPEAASWKPSLRPLAEKAAAVMNTATSNKQLRDGLLNIAYHANNMQRARSGGQNAIRNGELRRRRR